MPILLPCHILCDACLVKCGCFCPVLKAIGLTRDVYTLQKKLNHAANSTNVAIDVTGMGCFIVIEAGHIILADICTYRNTQYCCKT